jgi:hypothetical protein
MLPIFFSDTAHGGVNYGYNSNQNGGTVAAVFVGVIAVIDTPVGGV